MDPFTIAAVLTAGSALGKIIVGINAAKEAGRINEQTYQRLLQTAQDYEAEMQGNLPSGSVTPIQLEEFKKVVSDYVPEISKYIPEAAPQQVTEAGVGAERQAQKEALRQYGRMAQAGYDPIAAAQQEAALTASAAQASAARQAALREASQRGLGGTGLDVLAGMGAAEQEAIGGRQAALQAQQEAGQRRLQALGAYGTLAGQMRQQGTQTEQANVNIMNAFNERMARNLNQYNQYVAELKNQAQLQNRAEQQRMAEMNVGVRTQQQLMNVQAQKQAEAERRAAKERMFATKYGIQSGLGELQGKMRGQELGAQTAAWGQGMTALSKIGQTGLGAYYGTQAKKPKYTVGEPEELPEDLA
jgi:hypothetical protein